MVMVDGRGKAEWLKKKTENGKPVDYGRLQHVIGAVGNTPPHSLSYVPGRFISAKLLLFPLHRTGTQRPRAARCTAGA